MSQDYLKNSVIYYRVSTADQVDGFSLDNQKDACQKYADDKGFNVVKLFSDEGESAKTADRPGLQAMLKFVADKKNRINCIIVNKVDRLSRNVNDYSAIKSLLDKLGVELISTTEAIGNNSFGKFMGNMMASIAQLDNDVRSERVTDGIIGCLKSGRSPHHAPLGYLNQNHGKKDKSIVLDQARASTIKYLLEEFSKGIYTQEELRVKANKLGLTSKYGKQISTQLIHKILASKFYCGIIVSKYGEFKGSHPALISEQTYWKNQKQFPKVTKGDYIAGSRTDEEFPLRHQVDCGLCSRPLTACFSRGKLGKEYSYYRCYNKACPSKKAISKKTLEDAFSKFLKEVTPNQEVLATFKKVILDVYQNRFKELNQKQEITKKQIDQLNEEKAKLLELVKRNLLPDEDFKIEYTKVKEQLTDRQLELSEIKTLDFNPTAAVTFVFDFIADLPKFWPQTTYWQKHKLMGLIFHKKPIYDYKTFTTPKLSHIFQAKTALAGGENAMVGWVGIEPTTNGLKGRCSTD
jgi:site-specific DNA recombinase